MPHRIRASFGACVVALLCFMLACSDVHLQDAEPYGYDSDPIPITNKDWNVVALPNNLINPKAQADKGLNVPGAPPSEPQHVAIPIYTEEKAAYARELGYPDAQADSPLSRALIEGMNQMDGFIPGFILRIPFSKPIDPGSIVRYRVDDSGDNAATANFFMLDVTDPQNPQAFPTADYVGDVLAFDVERSARMPYYLIERPRPRMTLEDLLTASELEPRGFMPQEYQAGHTYLVVLTGYDETGIKDATGKPLTPDPFFLLFASPDPYIDKNGTPRCNILFTIEEIRELEMARLITDWGIRVWEELVGEARSRHEIVQAFHFTIAARPIPYYMDPAAILNPGAALIGQTVLFPAPHDKIRWENEQPLLVSAEASAEAAPRFSVPRRLDAASLDGSALGLFADSPGGLTPIAARPTLAFDEQQETSIVTLTPDAPLQAGRTYWVALNNRLRDEQDRAAIDESYFGLARAPLPLIEQNDDGDWRWLSPHIDNRIDTILSPLNEIEESSPGVLTITDEVVAKADADLIKVLRVIETLRADNQGVIERLIARGFIEEREQLVLLWRFTVKR